MNNNKKIKYFFIESIKPFKYLVFGQFAVALFFAIDLSLRPYLVKIMLDRIGSLHQLTNFVSILLGPAILFIIITALNVVITRFSATIWLYLNTGLKKHVCLVLVDRMFMHSHGFYLNNFAGNLASKIKDVMSGIPDLSKIMMEKIFSNSLAILIAIYTLMQANVIFGLILLAWITLYLVVSIKLSNSGNKFYKYSAEVRAKAVGHIVDLITNMQNVRLFNTKNSEKRILTGVLQDYMEGDIARDKFAIKILTFQGISFVVYQAICIYFLNMAMVSGSITIGDYALVFTINISIISCLWTLSREIGAFRELYGNISQALDKFFSPIEITNHEIGKELKVTNGEIIFENVTFGYSKDNYIFSSQSVKVNPGEKLGIVGPSGVGKTTFVNLILRLFEVESGKILIDKQNINSITQESLREAISYISQEPILFHRSIEDNIRYGSENATHEDIISAAKAAHAHEFIQTLPEGYNSIVGERGVKLSGGQRQRIAMTRIFLKNAPILVLDEPTSQLDSITEARIKQSLDKLMFGKTSIVIAHRLSTLLHMDRILVFDENSRVVEYGSHNELLSKNGLYGKLWQMQQQE